MKKSFNQGEARLCHSFRKINLLLPAKDGNRVPSMFPFQEYLSLAVIFVVYGILAKLAGRRDNDPAPLRNEFAISTSISLMTISKIFTDLFTIKTTSHQFLLAAAIGGVAPLFFVVLERYTSWHESPSSPRKKKIWVGIVLPDLLAIFILFLYYLLRYTDPST